MTLNCQTYPKKLLKRYYLASIPVKSLKIPAKFLRDGAKVLALQAFMGTTVHVRCTQTASNVHRQVDSPELPQTPEITEMTENFAKVTKYLTKYKETLINYVWKKCHVKKQ